MKRVGLFVIFFAALSVQLSSSNEGAGQAPKSTSCCNCNDAGRCFKVNQNLHSKILNLSLENQKLTDELKRIRDAPQTTEEPVELLRAPLGSAERPGNSCRAILEEQRDAPSGPYYVRTGNAEEQVYCHMTSLDGCGSGGWTTLMKVDGQKDTFKYTSSMWTEDGVFNVQGGATDFDYQETKLNTYNAMPFKKLCVVFKETWSGHMGYVPIDTTASSLLSLIQPNSYINVSSVQRSTWVSSIPEAWLQPYCNKIGFNVQADTRGYARERIGIISNNENDCGTCDTAIGVGSYWECGGRSAGYVFYCHNTQKRYFAYILAQ